MYGHRTGSRAISVLRTMLRSEGLRLPGGVAETVPTRLATVPLPRALADAATPLVELLCHLNTGIKTADAQLVTLATANPAVARLMTAPGIGPVTATAFVAVLDDVARFRDAGEVTSFLGLVPREYSSGERQHKGGITKTGDRHLRSLRMQAVWVVYRSSMPARPASHVGPPGRHAAGGAGRRRRPGPAADPRRVCDVAE